MKDINAESRQVNRAYYTIKIYVISKLFNPKLHYWNVAASCILANLCCLFLTFVTNIFPNRLTAYALVSSVTSLYVLLLLY